MNIHDMSKSSLARTRMERQFCCIPSLSAKFVVVLYFLIFFASTACAEHKDWETVSIPGVCTFQIPPTMEIQKGTFKVLSDKYLKKILEIESSPDNVVVQPKGLNDFDESSVKGYSRIMIGTSRDQVGDYVNLNDPVVVSAEGLEEINTQAKTQLEATSASMASNGAMMKILTWYPTKIVRVNGVDCILISYRRTMNDGPPALVKTYMIQNNDYLHTITTSFRESQRDVWEKDIDGVMESFRFVKR